MATRGLSVTMTTLATALALLQALTSSEARPDRRHFPVLPELPAEAAFIAVQEDTAAQQRTVAEADEVGAPLGPEDEDDDSLEKEDEDESETWTGPDLLEGDLWGVRVHSAASVADNATLLRNAVTSTFQLWPNGSVPYVVSAHFNRKERSALAVAMREVRTATGGCIEWRAKTDSDVDYVHIVAHDGCYSSVGRTQGVQILSLGRGCGTPSTALHEMLHALGLWHEQSRPDRDDHVAIRWSNISPGKEDNFARYDRGEVDTLGLPYDTNSLMHYHATAFSVNGKPTIIAKQKSKSSLGRSVGLSELDVSKLRRLYSCADSAPACDGADSCDGGQKSAADSLSALSVIVIVPFLLKLVIN